LKEPPKKGVFLNPVPKSPNLKRPLLKIFPKKCPLKFPTPSLPLNSLGKEIKGKKGSPQRKKKMLPLNLTRPNSLEKFGPKILMVP